MDVLNKRFAEAFDLFGSNNEPYGCSLMCALCRMIDNRLLPHHLGQCRSSSSFHSSNCYLLHVMLSLISFHLLFLCERMCFSLRRTQMILAETIDEYEKQSGIQPHLASCPYRHGLTSVWHQSEIDGKNRSIDRFGLLRISFVLLFFFLHFFLLDPTADSTLAAEGEFERKKGIRKKIRAKRLYTIFKCRFRLRSSSFVFRFSPQLRMHTHSLFKV